MLYGEATAVCSEIHTKHVNKAELYYRLSPYRAVNTLRQCFKNQSITAVWETMAVISQIHAKHVNKTELYYRLSSHRAVDTPRQGFKNQ
jgi:uncharacterized C2H2 Zn-finger protein